MEKFSCSLLYKSVHNNQETKDLLWEEKIILVEASSKEEALNKSKSLASSLEHSYTSATGDQVTWQFVKVGDVQEITDGKLEHGTEIFTRFIKGKTALSYDEPFD